jgi:hypothetical protein
MDLPSLPTIERIARKGRTLFSKWDMSLFQDYCRATLPRLMGPSPASETGQPVATAFAELLCEGIGRGYLGTSLHADPANLMEFCLRDWLLRRLSDGTTEHRMQLLADCWNMLEGLLREPRWVNSYVMARVRELEKENDLQSFLARVLGPLFEPAISSNWSGPFRVTTLSLRKGDEEFLPGDMHVVAPNILAVRDRRHSLSLGIILRKQDQSELAGIFADTAPYPEPQSAVTPHWKGEWLSFGNERIQLQFLAEPFRWIQLSAGFVVASAMNSQKLWIVESEQ